MDEDQCDKIVAFSCDELRARHLALLLEHKALEKRCHESEQALALAVTQLDIFRASFLWVADIIRLLREMIDLLDSYAKLLPESDRELLVRQQKRLEAKLISLVQGSPLI